MDWLDHHRESERLSFRASDARRENDRDKMSRLLRQAASAEEKAIETLSTGQPKTWNATAISIASLYLQAGDLDVAEERALQFLLSEKTSGYGHIRLRELLKLIWAEGRRIEHQGERSEAVVVEIGGNNRPPLGIPLNDLVSSAQHVKSSLYRTAELRRALPFSSYSQVHRGLGAKPCDLTVIGIDDYGDYYSVLIQEMPIRQYALGEDIDPLPLVDAFFNIADAAIESPSEALPEFVPDPAYRRRILEAFHKLAPSGRTIDFVGVRANDDSRGISLNPDTKRNLLSERKALDEQERSNKLRAGIIRGTLIGFDSQVGTIKLDSGDGEKLIVRVGKTVVEAYLEQIEDRKVEVHVAEDQTGRLLFRGLAPDSTPA